MTTSRVIHAVFEDGVFKPLQKVDVEEHEQVNIKIIAHDEWQRSFDRIIQKIHQRAGQYSPDEIDADITRTIREVRQDKRGR